MIDCGLNVVEDVFITMASVYVYDVYVVELGFHERPDCSLVLNYVVISVRHPVVKCAFHRGHVCLGRVVVVVVTACPGIHTIKFADKAGIQEYFRRFPLVDPDFQKISEGKYEPAEWYTSGHNTETYALQKGFISCYAMSEYNEDFAEMPAFYLIYTQAEWDAKMKTADAAYVEGSGKKPSEIIGQKLSMVRSYMLSAWDIDIQKLRTVVQRRMDEVVDGTVDVDEL